MVSTSVGWIEISFSDDQRFASLSRLDDSGWVAQETEWQDADCELADALEDLGIPSQEARTLAEQTEEQWLTRGGEGPQERMPPSAFIVIGAILVATVGVWLAGVAFLIWLLVRLAS